MLTDLKKSWKSLISGVMENALLMRVSVFTDQGGRKYMEDVTEVIVEPEPGEDDSTTGEGEEKSEGTFSPAVGDQDFTYEPAETTEVTGASCEPVKAEGNRLFVETSLPGSPSSPPFQPSAISHPRRSVAFFAVFDGHGGREAALFARDYLWEFMKKQRGFWSDCDREVCSAIRKGFVACHHAMWKKLRKFINNRQRCDENLPILLKGARVRHLSGWLWSLWPTRPMRAAARSSEPDLLEASAALD